MPRQLQRCFKYPSCLRLGLGILLIQLFFILFFYKVAGPNSRIKNMLLNNSTISYVETLNGNILVPSEGSWQNVTGITEYKFLIFSAFLEVRNKRAIRIIGVTKIFKRKSIYPKLWCLLWQSNGYPEKLLTVKRVEAQLKILQEHWNLPYSGYYVTCPLDENDPIPDAVSVVSNINEEPNNILKVIVNYDESTKWEPKPLENIKKMAVCVKPLHYDYNRVMELLEFVELHRILGVDHFFFYNHTAGSQLSCLLEKYKNEGIVTVLPWQLPIISQKEIRTEGIFASLNDCLYRTMHKYSHAIFIDFDEFIIPTENYTYREFFEFLGKGNDIKTRSSFSFQNSFFYRQWPDDPEIDSFDDPVGKNLIVLQKTIRKTDFHPHRTRSKLILRPELVDMVGNHFVWEYYNRKEFGNIDIKPKDAFLHHYRICEFGGDDCVTQSSIIDKTAYRYKDELVTAVKSRYNKYFKECRLMKLSDL